MNVPPETRPKVYGTFFLEWRLFERKTTLSLSSRVRVPLCAVGAAARDDEFHNLLASQWKTRWTIKQDVNYAKRFAYVLDTGNAPPLTLSPRNKQHAMTALASLSKYQGRYGLRTTISNRPQLDCHLPYAKYKGNGYPNEILPQDICGICSQSGVDSEIVNLLQGRIGKDVFVRHYNRPDLDTIFAKVRNSVRSLEKPVVKS